MRKAKRIVVICPASVRAHWCQEFLRFQYIDRKVCKGVNIHDFVAWKAGVYDVLVTSYELAAKWADYIHTMAEIIDVVIIDEGHYLKANDAARSKKILGEDSTGRAGIVQWAAAAWWLTGSPIPNDPIDIYTFLRFVGVMPLEKRTFVARYFNSRPRTYSSVQTPKADMLAELQKLIENNSIRRTLGDVGYQLPPIWLTNTFVDGESDAVLNMLRVHPGLDRAIREHLDSGRPLEKIHADHVETLRRLIGEAKALPYAEMLLGELRGGLDKAVVFGIHRTALKTVSDYLGRNGVRAVLVNGDTPDRDLSPFINSFQQESSCRVFVANIRKAGVGLTLTAAAALDMLESDWTPAGNAQAIKRVHRLTQTRQVRARFITLANSFDQVVNDIVAEKTATIASIERVSMIATPS
jgi:SNF2 family DNA or RNA helicase